MKKIFVMAVLALLANSVHALDHSVGIKGGIGLGMVTADTVTLSLIEETKVDPMVRGNVGVFYELGLTDMFAIQPQVFFGINNSIRLTSNVDNTYSSTLSYNSLDVELMFKGRFLNRMLYVGLAPTFSFGLGKVTSVNTLGGVTTTTGSQNFSDSGINTTLIGLALEVGSEIPMGPGAIVVGLKSQWNFNLTGKEDTILKARNHVPIALQAGYAIRF
jgi:hypothetical protein